MRSLRRLSNIEFKNTVAQFFPAVSGLDFSGLSTDTPAREAFDTMNVQPNFITDERFRGYVRFAESLSSKVDPAKVFACYKDGKSCFQAKLPEVLTNLWRRPPVQAEIDDLIATYDAVIKDKVPTDTAARFLIQAMVLSRGFVYRTELGTKKDAVYVLTPWEVASALSYGLTRKPPDATLLSLAKDGSLSKAAVVKAQVQRLLADESNKSAWKEFGTMWLEANRINDKRENNPKYPAAVKKDLENSMSDFFTSVFYSKNSSFLELLNADYTLAGSSTDFIYGAKAENGKVNYKEAERRGLLGNGNFLVGNALEDGPNPIKRGVFVLDRLLCISFAPPPDTTPPAVNMGKTNKERFANHSNGSCKACHVYIDEAGFAFEHFDQDGAFRTMDAGKPVVVDSKLTIDDEPRTFTSPEQLSLAIGESRQGKECFARQAFRYTMGRMEHYPHLTVGGKIEDKFEAEGKLDACQISAMADAMEAKSGDMREGILALFTNPGFLNRIEGQ
ncbi:MAG: DUF1592 domain-containing protein [Proteobacteria bacterium]|nr:MAG: DUF1592 domain-containing protein [Pseudomonadota bacterium]